MPHRGGEEATIGWLGYLFISFFAVVIATQLVPAAITFIGMLKGIEYLICLAFFVSFPMFYRYLNHDSGEAGQ